LGVLHDLERENLVPSELVGTSIGSIIASCIAIGMSEEQIYTEIKKFSSISKWIKFSFNGNAIVDNAKIEAIFLTIFGKKKIYDTQIPLKIIATNLRTGNKRLFSAKDDIYIKDAILASMAIPGIFDEHIIESETYGDGFLCENLGVNEASFNNVLAIDVLGKNSFEQDMPDNFFKTANVIEMFEKSMRLLIYNQSQTHLIHSKKNILLIEPCTKEYATFSFHKHQEIRTLGLGLLNKHINKD
jgi:NTE family protein